MSVLDTEFLRFEPEHPIGIPEGFLEVSARLGAKYVLVMSAEPEEARTLERFGELCDRAAQYGLHVGLEFAIYTGVRTLAHAAQMVAQSKRANASVLVDALHFSRSGGLPAHIAAGRSVALPLRADLRRGGRHARPHRYARPDPRGAHRPAAARRGRAAARASWWRRCPPAMPLAIEAPCRATADLPALERAQRAYRALSALLAT